jgi:hypothetical protein
MNARQLFAHIRALLVGIAALLLLACGGDDGGDPLVPSTGSVRVTTATTGGDLDVDGYTAVLDTVSSEVVGANSSVTFGDIEPGEYVLELTGVAANCAVSSDNPLTLEVSAGQTTNAVFNVLCIPIVAGGWIGQYSVLSCTRLSGSDPLFCEDIFYDGRSLGLELSLSQDRTSVSGVAQQGQLSGGVTGNIDEFGVLVLSGTLGVSADATTTIEQWETVVVGDSLVGNWVFEVDDNTGSNFGTARVETSVLLVNPAVPNYVGCPAESELAHTDQVVGTLEAGDCQLDDESYYDVYTIDVATGDQVEFRMSSPDFEPALLIIDLQERIVGCSLPVPSEVCNRNAPDNLATLALEAVVGETWLVVANAFRALDVGEYTLTTARPALASATRAASLEGRLTEPEACSEVRVGSPETSAGHHRGNMARNFLRAPSTCVKIGAGNRR